MKPGRVGFDRPVPALFFLPRRLAARTALATLPLWLLPSCASWQPPEAELGPLWAEYRALPPERALAVAGELRQDRWVAGAAGGAASRAEAAERALEECARRRAARRFQDPCRLYAVGDEVVWPLGDRPVGGSP